MSSSTVLYTGLSSDAKQILVETLKDLSVTELPFDLEKFMDIENTSIKVIVTGPPPETISALEAAQTLRGIFPTAQLILITDRSLSFSKKDLIKNGYNEVYYLPIDAGLLETDLKSIREIMGYMGLNLVTVKATDIMELGNLDFETYIYLPANGRYVPFSSKDEFTESKKNKLKDFGVTNIHIQQKDLPIFYELFAEAIKRLQKSDKMSETEKRQVLKEIVRDLVAELFTDSITGVNTGMKLNKHCKDIVQAYISSSKVTSGWHEKITTVASGREDFYAYSTNSMVASTLIAIGLGFEEKSIDALAVAGLLHHIGFSRLPHSILSKALDEMSSEEKNIYKTHPQLALEILKEKKVVLPELSYKIILQQDERYDGEGFPSNLQGPQICPEAQILHLTTILMEKIAKKGKFTNFREVFDDFKKEVNSNPAYRPIGQALFSEISDLFTTGQTKQPDNVSSSSWKMGR